MVDVVNLRDEIRGVCETALDTVYTALGIDAPVNIFTDDMIDDALLATIDRGIADVEAGRTVSSDWLFEED